MIKVFFLFLCSMSFADASEAIGYYSEGQLREAASVVDRNLAIHKLFLDRKKFFTTEKMSKVIEEAALFVKKTYPSSEMLQVGDLSGEEGGLSTGHASHQNGLDVDIVYLTKKGRLQSSHAPYWEEDFVKSGQLSSNFYVERNFNLLKYLVTRQSAARIFVDMAIKKKLCEYAAQSGTLNNKDVRETLRRLRVEKLHSTHFHVRLNCPAEDKECRSQAEVPLGTGCDRLSLEEEAALNSGEPQC